MKLSLRGLLPFLIFFLLSIAFAISLTKDPSKLPSHMIDRPLPEFALSDLFDPTHIYRPTDFVGATTLFNVFGSWCVACVQEHPMLMSLSRQNRVKLVGIDWRDTRENAKQWLQRYGNPYDHIIYDDASQLAIDLGVTGAPESFLVDASGHIRYKYVGIITPDVWQDILLPTIKELERNQATSIRSRHNRDKSGKTDS